MNPKLKLVLAAVLLLGLGAAAGLHGASTSTIARAVLAVCALGGLGWWLLRAGRAAVAADAPRLSVLSRLGLAHRTGVALVEVDGRTFLVVHGDGFAQVSALASARKRRPSFKTALRSVS